MPRRHDARSPVAIALIGTAALTAPAVVASCRSGAARTPPGASSPARLEALYRARADSALDRFTQADVDFMRRMIGHHAQALMMAALAPDRAGGASVRTLATRITVGQEAEIELMRGWLRDRGLAPPGGVAGAVGGPDGADRGTGPGEVGRAPGMLTPEQMRSLEAAEGVGFDRLFLALMIRHHQGAVTMVERLFETPDAARDATTFRIASGIQVDQRSEIARMESMLDALGGAPRP